MFKNVDAVSKGKVKIPCIGAAPALYNCSFICRGAGEAILLTDLLFPQTPLLLKICSVMLWQLDVPDIIKKNSPYSCNGCEAVKNTLVEHRKAPLSE